MDRHYNSRRMVKDYDRSSRKDVKEMKGEYKMDSGVRVLKPEPIRLSDDEIKLLIPPFDPVTTTGLSAADWIALIENFRIIYDWNDRLTLLYASRRLEGDAKRWFAQHFCKWHQFKARLLQMFPDTFDRTQVFERLMRRSKDDDESYEKYAFDIERMAMKCGFSLDTAINYIVAGLRDNALRTHLVVCNCKTITELLYRIQCFKAVQNSQNTQNRHDHDQSVDESEFEHKLKRPLEKSTFETSPKKTVSTYIRPDSYRDLMTTVKVKDAYLTAFVSLDSDCTAIKLSEFERHDLKMKQCNDTVHILGSRPVQAVGCFDEMVTAGEVIMLTKVFVVDDSYQVHPMILGRNFINSPKVRILKSYRSLEIRWNTSERENCAPEIVSAIKEEDDVEEKQLLELLDFIESDL